MTNLDSILKSRDVTLLTKVHLVKAMVYPVVMHACESWTIKKAERWEIDAFELWCWRRFLRLQKIKPVNPKGNQSWIFIGTTDAEDEAPILWPPDANSLEKTLMPGKIEAGGKGWDGWMASPTHWTWVWVGSGSWWWTEKPGMLQSMRLQTIRHNWASEQQQQILIATLGGRYY